MSVVQTAELIYQAFWWTGDLFSLNILLFIYIIIIRGRGDLGCRKQELQVLLWIKHLEQWAHLLGTANTLQPDIQMELDGREMNKLEEKAVDQHCCRPAFSPLEQCYGSVKWEGDLNRLLYRWWGRPVPVGHWWLEAACFNEHWWPVMSGGF